MSAMKENVNSTDKAVEKVLRHHQRQTDQQLDVIKESVMKLAEMMTEEFSSVRDELQSEVSKQCHALMSRRN